MARREHAHTRLERNSCKSSPPISRPTRGVNALCATRQSRLLALVQSALVCANLRRQLLIFFAAFASFAVNHPQQFRRHLQTHQQPSCCFAINPASNQSPGHHGQRYLNALEVRKQVGHFAFRFALAAHLRHRFGQHHPPFQFSAKGHRLLRGMRMAYRCALLCRGLALLAIPAEQLAPPVISVSRLRGSCWQLLPCSSVWISSCIKLSGFCFSITKSPIYPDYQILPAPLPHGLRLGFQRSYSIQPQKFRVKSGPNRVELASNRVKSVVFLLSITLYAFKVSWALAKSQ